MKRLLLLVVFSMVCMGLFAQAKQIAQNAKAVYEFDSAHKVHIVSFDQAFEHDFYQQKAIYDIQFQMNALKKPYMSINIAQYGASSDVMKLVEMFCEPKTSYVGVALKNHESLFQYERRVGGGEQAQMLCVRGHYGAYHQSQEAVRQAQTLLFYRERHFCNML